MQIHADEWSPLITGVIWKPRRYRCWTPPRLSATWRRKQFGRFSMKTLITDKHYAPPSRGDTVCKYSTLPAATARGLIFPNDKQRLWRQTVCMGTKFENRLLLQRMPSKIELLYSCPFSDPYHSPQTPEEANTRLVEAQMPLMTS